MPSLPTRARRRRPPLSLTRELIARSHPARPPDDQEATGLASEEELAASLDAFLTDVGGELWVFAYGSLMWRPDFEFAEQRPATLRGWHRRFCLWQWRFRGTPETPGLMLALDRGGSCVGMAYKVVGPDLRAKVMPVWRREMRGRGYRPRWVVVGTPHGPVRALTFVANRDGERYAGRLSDPEIADRIALACGPMGPSADYLLNTVAHCEAMGIHDRHLWRLQALVAERMVEA
jgi:glutathione-specific gamma-glutamylcyclotransferase